MVMQLLAPHGAQAFTAFSYYSTTTTLLYIIQIFSSNLSNPSSRGGIKWSLYSIESMGITYST